MALASARWILICLGLLLIVATAPQAATSTTDSDIQRRNLGALQVEARSNRATDPPSGAVIVRRSGRTIFKQSSDNATYSIAHGHWARYPGPFASRDAVVVRKNYPSFHCCDAALIFLLQPEFRALGEIPNVFWGERSATSAVEADLLVLDAPWNPGLSIPASIYCEVNLRLHDGALRVDPRLQRRPPYSRRFLAALAGKLQQPSEWGENAGVDAEINPSLLQFMLTLTYSGNPEQAFELMRLAWRPEITGQEKWRAEYAAAMRQSRYAAEIEALADLPSPGRERDEDLQPICYPPGDQ